MGERALPPIALAVLGLLVERPMHPYEMYSTLLERKEDRLFKLRPGTLYHQVGVLEKAALIEEIGTDRAGNRPERTTYQVTERGQHALAARLRELISSPEQEYPLFALALSGAHNLPLAEAIELLGGRRRQMADELADLRAQLSAYGDKPKRWVLDVLWSEHQLASDLAFLDALLDDMSAGRTPWDEEADRAAGYPPHHHISTPNEEMSA
jgi:DNA-binding PadR family transcriptional regulator